MNLKYAIAYENLSIAVKTITRRYEGTPFEKEDIAERNSAREEERG